MIRRRSLARVHTRVPNPVLAIAARVFIALLPLVGTPGLGSDSPNSTSLEGVWRAERDFGPDVGGTVTVTPQEQPTSETWRVQIADFDFLVDAPTPGQAFRFDLPYDAGAFRGAFAPDGRTLRGHWIQPTTLTRSYPFASPLHFSKRGARWVAEARPFPDRIHLYLNVGPADSDGPNAATHAAYVRNPERNLGIQLRVDAVRREANSVTWLAGEREVATGRFLAAADSSTGEDLLSIFLPNAGVTFDFTRATRSRAEGLFAARDQEPYRYRAPAARGEDWPVARAEDVGVRSNVLEELVRSIRSAEPTGIGDPTIHALLIARRGQLVLEEYFHGFGPDTPHDTRSAGKSIASMIAGAALDRGINTPDGQALALDSRLVDVLPEHRSEPAGWEQLAPHAERSTWRSEVRLAHLLSMNSGLYCDDNDWDAPGNEGRMQSQSEQPDWRAYMLDVPMFRAPGSEATYCSNDINLALTMVQRAAGRWLPEMFREWLAEPMGIETYYANLSPVGDGYMGGGLYLRPRDQLKFAQVMLDGGQWQGVRVLSEQWVEGSLAGRSSINGTEDTPDHSDYGLAWWRLELTHPQDESKHLAYYASGNGGQLFILVPSLELAVQFSGGNYSHFPVWIRWVRELLPERILPAIVQ